MKERLMFQPTVITKEQAIMGFLKWKYPEQVAEVEKLVDDLVNSGMTGIASRPENVPEETR